MCGRLALFQDVAVLAFSLGAEYSQELVQQYRPSYNISPSSPVLVAFSHGENIQLSLAHWWFRPDWADGDNPRYPTFNARCETVRTKPTFRHAFESSRCVLPVNGFYEWRKQGQERQPFFFCGRDRELIFLAGIFSRWRGQLITCSVITTPANHAVSKVHHRMPAIVKKSDLNTWLFGSPEVADELLRPASEDFIHFYEVSRKVN